MIPPIDEAVAIIGLGCRFPGGCSSPSKLWKLLREPRDTRKQFDPSRFNMKRFYNADGQAHGSTDVRMLSYLLEDDNRVFDAGFFSISPAEAASMDPQQRILLEVVYEACESAGVTLKQLRGSSTSVHVGSMSNDYSMTQARDTETLPKYYATGAYANSIISNRVSYVFDLKGPSVTLDTACSSSLVALHQAVQGLHAGDCDAAIVGGTNLILEPGPYIAESKLQMLSPESQCRMWDASANGYGRGEGIAALLLKPLSRALADGDPVQGVIRATGVNSDGQSQGITMPLASAQTELIRQTYRRAGLDLRREMDRPQYFECHGTGTQAGDPVEARAVYDALFRSPDGLQLSGPPPSTLIVGSIKTVIGHTEGCAGLAGVIKVLLMMKHQMVAPNMLFNELNPKIAPYWGPGALEITTKPLPWPTRPAGAPLRASVNSFGFGGTNAHVILEAGASIDEDTIEASGGEAQEAQASAPLYGGALGPLLFSAQSGPALLRNVQSFLAYAEEQAPSLDLQKLSWTLQTRRSTHRVRAFFTGKTREEVLGAMRQFVLSHAGAARGSTIGSEARLVNPRESPGILGVFTGQGAQWATMGRELMGASPLFLCSLKACDAVLQHGLPAGHGRAPEWSLMEELAKDAGTSRLGEAALAQPLCTALQIAQVDLLRVAGIHLDAVVGHSSGEIAATYAAGLITREAAMQIAYYRGFYAHLGRVGSGGGMLAVGLGLQAASDLCRQAPWAGRLVVAASNAPQSCTLSGDLDAIVEAEKQLGQDGIFVRRLLVDTAYHSHHMEACADAYLQALLACDITVTPPRAGCGRCVWSSSVRGDARLVRRGSEADLAALSGPYWVANMVQMVRFSQALESSLWHGGPFDLAIELGPHPALRGPVEQTLKAAYGSAPRYTSLAQRKVSDVTAVQDAIGTVWAQLGPAHVNFAGFHGIWSDGKPATPATAALEDLPPYSWDHDKVYWRESRTSARFRTLPDGPQELLGRRVPDDNDYELRWRNILRLKEIPWLRGHVVLGEVLLPGAAYVSIAAQAAQCLAGESPVSQIAVEDVDILRPVVVPDDGEGVETLFTVQVLTAADKTAPGEPRAVRARFAYYMCPNEARGTMIHSCRGMLTVRMGANGAVASQAPILPPREPVPDGAVHVGSEAIHAMFGRIGLDYQDAFAALGGCDRTLGYASSTATWPADSEASLGPSCSTYVLHPVVLDVAFQTLFVAHTHPATQLLRTAMLPSHIDRVVVDPSVQVADAAAATVCFMDAWVTAATGTTLDGDISLYAGNGASTRAFAQVEGLQTRAAGGRDASQDRHVFCRTAYGRDVSVMGLELPPRDPLQDARTQRINEATERLTLWYMRRVLDEVPSIGERDGLLGHHKVMLEAFEHHLDVVRQGRHPLVRSAWLADGPEVVAALDREHGDTVEFRLMHAVGGVLGRAVQHSEAHIVLEAMNKDELLNHYYMQNSTSVATNRAIGQLLNQVAFKFPRCDVLEIGAGTGGTTWSALNALGEHYETYTFTDVSPAFFPAAATKFADFGRLLYRTLDVEKDLEPQGFAQRTHDIVIAANVLHATRSLDDTLARVRTLLRPGGYLVLLETTGLQSMVGFLFGGLAGWWQSTEPTRRLGPTVPALEWHRLLGRTGFSGADTVVYDSPDESRHVTSCIVSRAADVDVRRLLQPLLTPTPSSEASPPLLLVGGARLDTARIVDSIVQLLPEAWKLRVRVVPSIDSLDAGESGSIAGRPDVLCLQDLDEPLFAALPMPPARLRSLQQLLMASGRILWVTAAGASSSPRARMIHGIMRVVPKEMSHLSVQVLGLELGAGTDRAIEARRCLEALLRLRHMDKLREENRPLPLWAVEPEYDIMADGEVRIPRVLSSTELNQRFAARDRPIIRATDATDATVQAVVNSGRRMELRLVVDPCRPPDDGPSPTAAQLSVQFALHIPCGDQKHSVYLVCGRVLPADDWAMTLSATNGSKLPAVPGRMVRVDASDCSPTFMKTMAHALLRRALVRRVVAQISNSGSEVVIVLWEPDRNMAERIDAELRGELDAIHTESHVELYCVTTRTGRDEVPASWLRAHAGMSRRHAKQLLPPRVGIFVDCSGGQDAGCSGSSAREQLQASVPPSCQMLTFDGRLLQEFIQSPSKPDSKAQPGAGLSTLTLEPLFAGIIVQIKKATDVGAAESETGGITVEAADLAGADAASLGGQPYLCDWRRQNALPLTLQPPEADVAPGRLFRPDRTYIIMGGSGGLGLSITRWLLDGGARNIVLTSRQPRPNDTLQAEAQRVGASVHMLAVDVTQRDQVAAAVATVRETMPPIAGVCNFSMVLHDAMFLDMEARQLNETLAAKVVGTEILDDIFGPGAEPLDFFIVTSSAATTIGNVAQANYHAANLCMDAVVARRRARGLPASIVHIGWVADTGYITRFAKEKQLADHFRSIRLAPLSETDVRDSFAVAVRASRVGSATREPLLALEHDITMGLTHPTVPQQPGQDTKAVWTSDPRLMALRPYRDTASSSPQSLSYGVGRSTGTDVRDQVAQAATEVDAIAAVAAAFSAKLETMLQLTAGAIQESNGLERPIIDLGIDSLVAVEIRKWFLKELNTDVPIVRVLGGETVLQVAATAAKRLLADRKEEQGIQPAHSPAPQDIRTAKDPVVAAVRVPVPHTSTESKPESYAYSAEAEAGEDSAEDTTGSRSLSPTPSRNSSNGGDVVFTPLDDSVESLATMSGEDVAPKTASEPVITREAPMSAAQSRFWFAHRHADNPAACNNAFYYRLQGRVNPARLRHALNLVASHHECLRTCYYSRLEDGHPMQGVMESSALQFTHTEHGRREMQTALQRKLAQFKTHAWDLERGQTMAVALLSPPDGSEEGIAKPADRDTGYIVLGYHHITLDGWSVALFWRNVDRAYHMEPLAPVSSGTSYIDYSLRQLGEEETGGLDPDLTFWRDEFATSLPEVLPLLPMARGPDRAALARQPSPAQQPRAHNLDLELSPVQLAAVKSLCQRLRVSPFHVHLALFQILLARLAGIDDVCVGVVDANRRETLFSDTLGCFVNILPVRVTVPPEADVASVVRSAARKAMAAFAHGAVPLDRILDLAGAPRSTESHPLFQASINYRAAGIDIWDLPLGPEARAHLSWHGAKEAENPYDVSLGFFETPTGCLAQIWCSANCYGPGACRTLLEAHLRLLETVAADPSVPVRRVALHDQAHVRNALEAGLGPETHFNWPLTLSRRVRDMCHLYPRRLAVKDGDRSLSYAELATSTHHLASLIRATGVAGSASRVAVLCEPSIDSVVALLAVLEAGGLYMPLDVSLPSSRHADMVRLCEPTLVLCHQRTLPRTRELLETTPCGDGNGMRVLQVDSSPVTQNNSRDDEAANSDGSTSQPAPPAFLLFTSGSTGTPKGILLKQENIINHIALKTEAFDLGAECVLQQSSLGFDMALIQTFSALANGGCLVIAPSDIRRDPVALASLVHCEAITMTIATPTEYLSWIQSSPGKLSQSHRWRLAFSGGEQIPHQLPTDLSRLGIAGLRLINCYGPTEITAAATFHPIPLDKPTDGRSTDQGPCLDQLTRPVSAVWKPYVVGKALPNYTVCILDAAGAPQPLGHTGEICIGGAGVALGYLSNPDLTRDKFVTGIPGMAGTLYRTGDKGRLLADGTLLCLGRLDGDTQIKLRGQRIELQEVELAVLQASEGALASVVVTLRRLDTGVTDMTEMLIAHATLAGPEGTTMDEATAARLLARVRLPQAFVPAALYILPAMPMTSNGKTDRKRVASLALPERNDGLGVAGSGTNRPVEKLAVREGELRLLWERVLPALDNRAIGPSSDFFLRGGNSLLLMKLQRAIKETTGIDVTTKRMYEATTLRAMTKAVFGDENTHSSGTENEPLIDWEAETAVPTWLQDRIEQLQTGGKLPATARTKTTGIEVILTGATSFLGSHLLSALCSNPAVGRVHCIAVPLDHQTEYHASSKAIYYAGSLLSPTLGLAPSEQDTLARTVDVIVHAGAHGHCLNRYANLRQPNLESLHVLASLAIPRSVPLLFLSSPRCLLLAGDPDQARAPGSLRLFPPGTDGRDGYTASKWAGEVFLERLVDSLNSAGRSGPQIAVHRPCTLVSDKAPNSDAMNGIIRYSIALRCVPRLKRAEGFLDFAPLGVVVDKLTAAVVELALPSGSTMASPQPADIHFCHHSGGIKTPFSEFRAHMETVYGHSFDEIDMEDWLVLATQRGLDPLITAYIEALLESDMPLKSPYLGAA